MNSLLGFSFSPPVINPLSDSSLTCLGCQWVPQGRRRAVKWILTTCWFEKDLLQPQLVSDPKIRPWQWLPGWLPPSCRQYPLSTAYCCSGQVPCASSVAYLLFRLPQVTLSGMKTLQAAPCWPSLAPPIIDVSKSSHFSPSGEASFNFQCHFSS